MKITIASKSEPVSLDRFIKQIQFLCKVQKINLLYPGTVFKTTNSHFITEDRDGSIIIHSEDDLENEYYA